jgi:hypothetical protein
LDPKIGCDAVAPPLSGLAFDLPDIPFSLDQEIDIKNLEINNLGFNGNSPINIGKVETNETPLGDLEYATSAPDPIGFTSAQVDDPKLQPIQLPKLSLPDLATIINIDKLGSSEIPLEIESSTGGSDVNVPLLDWHPRWREEICIKVWRFKKCAFVEFGINLNISLYYRWNITLLRFTVAIRNAFANGISVALKATGIVLETIQIGLLKALKVSSSVVR